MYKDSSMKEKEKKKRFRCEVSELYELASRANHVTGLGITFFRCDLRNVRVGSLTFCIMLVYKKPLLHQRISSLQSNCPSCQPELVNGHENENLLPIQ